MKIKKTPLSTEIEITPTEIREFYDRTPPGTVGGLFLWLRDNFNLDLFPKPKENK